MTDDIVKRLRTVDEFSDAIGIMDAAADEIERLRALIIQWDAAFFGRRGDGDWLPEVSLVDAEFALHEEARRG